MRILFTSFIALFIITSAHALEVAISNNSQALNQMTSVLSGKIETLTTKLTNITACLSQKKFVNADTSCLDVLHVRNIPPSCTTGQSISWNGTAWSCIAGTTPPATPAAPTPTPTPTPAPVPATGRSCPLKKFIVICGVSSALTPAPHGTTKVLSSGGISRSYTCNDGTWMLNNQTGSCTPAAPTCTILTATCSNSPRFRPYSICEKRGFNATTCKAYCVYAYPTRNFNCP